MDIFNCEETWVEVIVYRRNFVCVVFRLIGTRNPTAFLHLQHSKNKCQPTDQPIGIVMRFREHQLLGQVAPVVEGRRQAQMVHSDT